MSTRVLARILTGVLLLFQSGPALVWADLKESGCPENFRDLNINAQLSFEQYDGLVGAPNNRPLKGERSYESHLLAPIEESVPEGGVHIDVGGGRGTAALELAKIRHSTAIVINAQKADDEILDTVVEMNGRFRYVEGWAEDQLPRFKNRADLITDVYGAYAYSIKKPDLVKLMYDALKPGGTARIFTPPNSKAWVKFTKKGMSSPMMVSLPEYLAAAHPDIFSIVKHGPRPDLTRYQQPYVLVIRKPLEAKELNLNLQYVNHIEEDPKNIRRPLSPQRGPPTPYSHLKQIAPEITFEARDPL
ncbi:hypothetical protein K2X30_12215 [bacterium]|jgi:SAM-dependent methyltransferase|nr:hypothetical protein [bacterium]